MRIQMNKELQGLCLCIAMMGVTYAILLMLLLVFTGVKLYKTIAVVLTFSALLFTLGLNAQVKERIKQRFNQLL